MSSELRKRTFLLSLSLFLGFFLSIAAANQGTVYEVPDPKDFTANDPYQGMSYEERPTVQEVPEILNVTDLLRSTAPIFWKHKTSISKGGDVGQLTDIKQAIAAQEQEIIHEIKRVPGILEILDDNKDLEAQIQSFLTLRRAEVRDIHVKVRKLKDDLEKEKNVKVTDISSVGSKIQGLYDEIDLHLEDPTSRYNDDFILKRKEKIRRLMRKKKVLKRDFERLEYPKMKSIHKKIEFLEERRKEIHEKSRDLSFKYVQRRIGLIDKNNNRINYLISIHMKRSRVRQIRAKLASLHAVRNQLDTAKLKISEKGSDALDLEADIRFEEKYYEQVARREKEILDEIRRSREMIHGLRSGSSEPDRKQSIATPDKAQVGKSGAMIQKQDKQETPAEHVYVIPMRAGLDLPGLAEIPRMLQEKAQSAGTKTPSGIVYVMPIDKMTKEPEVRGRQKILEPEISSLLQERNEKNLARIHRLEDRLSRIAELMDRQANTLEALSKRPTVMVPVIPKEPVSSTLAPDLQPPVETPPSSSSATSPVPTVKQVTREEIEKSPALKKIILENLKDERNFRSR